jgi:hypothetical protein
LANSEIARSKAAIQELQLDIEETRTQYITSQKRVRSLEEHIHELNGHVGKAGNYEARISSQEKEIADLRGHIASMEMKVYMCMCVCMCVCVYIYIYIYNMHPQQQ